MAALIPCVQIFKDVPEKVSSVSLRRDLSTGTYVAVMRFQTLASLAHFRCFGRRSGKTLYLIDTEGEILIAPFIKMLYGGPEGEDIRSVECQLEIGQDTHWERLMRFMHRYADANGLTFRETGSDRQSELLCS
ncbi:MAG: photosystem II reaction center protein Psb28 [Leptolyngbya sp. SIO1E4]|nr:photosystem II reaction center protein Psb28 [Leptolyngbya sp. SIO1E4]